MTKTNSGVWLPNVSEDSDASTFRVELEDEGGRILQNSVKHPPDYTENSYLSH
jgi:hypothetical protein